MPSKETIEIVAALVTIIGLPFAIWQLWLGRRASSSNALISLNESLRQAWLNFKDVTDEGDIQHSLADIMNILETTSAAWADHLFVGATGGMVKSYLIEILSKIFADASAQARIAMMRSSASTFIHIKHFVRAHQIQFHVKIPNWIYE